MLVAIYYIIFYYYFIQAYIDVVKVHDLSKREIVTSGFLTKLVSALFPDVTVR